MKILNYLKSLLYFLIPLIVLLFIITILYYFDILNNNIVKYFKILSLLLCSLLGGIHIGKHSSHKGYLSGIKLSLIIISLFLIINLFIAPLSFKVIIYYLIITVTTTLGSMMGINFFTKKT